MPCRLLNKQRLSIRYEFIILFMYDIMIDFEKKQIFFTLGRRNWDLAIECQITANVQMPNLFAVHQTQQSISAPISPLLHSRARSRQRCDVKKTNAIKLGHFILMLCKTCRLFRPIKLYDEMKKRNETISIIRVQTVNGPRVQVFFYHFIVNTSFYKLAVKLLVV